MPEVQFTDADDPVLEAILDEMRYHPRRAASRGEWLAEPPFRDDPEARARLRIDVARRAANAIGKLQAIDEYTAKEADPTSDVPF